MPTHIDGDDYPGTKRRRVHLAQETLDVELGPTSLGATYNVELGPTSLAHTYSTTTEFKAVAEGSVDVTPQPILANAHGALQVAITDPESSYFGVSTTQLVPVFTVSFGKHACTWIWDTDDYGNGAPKPDITNWLSVVETGTSAGGYANLQSRSRAVYSGGTGIICRFGSAFTMTGPTDATQWSGMGNEQDGFFFGVAGGNTPAVLYRSYATGTIVDTAIPYTSWTDPCDGTGQMPALDFTEIQTFQIVFQQGRVTYSIQNPNTGRFQQVHYIQRSGNAPFLSHPTFAAHQEVLYPTGGTSYIVTSTFMGLYYDGPMPHPEMFWSHHDVVAGITNAAEVPLLMIENRTWFKGGPEWIAAYPLSLYVTCTGTRAAFVHVYEGGTITGGAFTNVDTNCSIMKYNTGGSHTGGHRILTITIEPGNCKEVNLRPYINQLVRQKITVKAICVANVATEIAAAINWGEFL